TRVGQRMQVLLNDYKAGITIRGVAIKQADPPSPAPVAVAAVPPVAPSPTATPADATSASPDPLADSGGTPGLKPAKALFGAVKSPAPLAARAIGGYAKGCLSGGQALPVDGPAWQAMRLSRNRNWGHPKLINLIEKLAADGKENDGWTGLLVGDLAQPRGGPMITGHASHQIGLDADLWLTPMPDRRLTNKERETIEATSMLSDDGTTVNRDVWTEQHFAILKRAASYPEVERIFVHPAIKQVLCYAAKDKRGWLSKVRPYWGHHYHFHVRMHCPAGSADCEPQKSVPGEDGCGKELEDWLKLVANIKADPAPLPIPSPPVVAAKPKVKPPMTLDQLPRECSIVLENGNPQLTRDIAAAAKAAEIAKAVKVLKANEKAASPHAASAQRLPQTAPAASPAPAATPKPHAVKPHASQKKPSRNKPDPDHPARLGQAPKDVPHDTRWPQIETPL
ncbi:MAG: penicillin-insensitive murein endopeptidase, partial [Hyphomicrobiaceae bacterium]